MQPDPADITRDLIRTSTEEVAKLQQQLEQMQLAIRNGQEVLRVARELLAEHPKK